MKIDKIARFVRAGRPLVGLLCGLSAGCVYQNSASLPKTDLPPETSNEVNQQEDFVTEGIIAMRTHTVLPGDNLSKIARRYNTTVSELKRVNEFDDNRANRLKVGEEINIPW